jgi:hypothetical protein
MSTPVRRHRTILHALLGTALAVAACNKPKDDGVVAPDKGGGTGTATGPGAPVELAPVEHPSQLLPRGTAVLVTATSMTRAAEVFERDRLVETFGPQYTSLRSMLVGSVGIDLLDPKAWTEAGLDPGGTVGVAVTDLANARIIVFATVSDRKKLVDLVRSLAGKAQMELVEEVYGSASLLRPKGDDDDGAIILRDRLVALTLDTGGKGPLELAKLMVTMDPNVSLASEAKYRKATGGLRAADVAMYLDVAGMVDQANMEAQQRKQEQPAGSWAEEELARAKKEGASPERLAELERQAAEFRQNEEYWRRRDEGQRALAELVVSGIEGVGITATAKRSGPVLDGRVVAEPDAFVRRLLANRQGASALPTAMNGAPLWCNLMRIDPTAAIELAEAFAGAEGMDPAGMRAGVKRLVGVDPEADIVPVLGGDLDLCVAVEGAPGKVDPEKQLQLGATIQTTDAAKAKYVLAKIATSNSELGKRMKKRGEGYTVQVDTDRWKTVHLQTAGDRIVLSNDPELAKRLAAGDPGSMPSKIRPPAATGAIGLQGTTVTQALDLSLSVLWTMVGRASFGEPMVVARGLTPEEMEKVPLSATSKKAKKAMEKARAQVDALEAKREAVEIQQVLEITDGLGILVAAATEDDRGFTLTGGQFLRAESLGRVLETILRATIAGGPSVPPADQKALDEAWQRYSDAQNTYTQARMEDGEKFLKKRGGGKAAEPVPAPAP